MKILSIGHLDSGINTKKYPELKPFIQQFKFFDDIGKESSNTPADTSGHGTTTALAIYNFAPKAKLYSAAVINSGHVYPRILAGLDWMLELPIKVASMAIGFNTIIPLFEKHLKKLHDKGVLIVIPSGNGGTAKSYTPAWSPYVLTVGAYDKNKQPSEFSSAIHTPEGACIKPEILALENFKQLKGTSFASSYVAGKAAAIWQQHPEWNLEQIKSFIIRQAEPIEKPLDYKAKYGFFDLEKPLLFPKNNQNDLLTTTNTIFKYPKNEPFIDPYLLKTIDIYLDHTELHVLVTWKTGVPQKITKKIIQQNGVLINSFLNGNITHIKTPNLNLKELLHNKFIEAIHTTKPPIF